MSKDYRNYRKTGNTNAYNTIRATVDFAGGWFGSSVGLKFGTMLGTSLGGVSGAVIGGAVGGIMGSFGVSWCGTSYIDYLYGK